MGKRESVASNQFQERPYREPTVQRTSNSKTCMGQEEFLVDVVGAVGFTVQQTFALNPGLAASFPWLSIEAQGWERYRFRKLNFRYTTSTGSTTPGTVIMAPDYDAADAAPATQAVALTYKDRKYCPPWELDKLCRLQPASMNSAFKEHFVRTGALAANQDVKTYDVGNLYLCVTGGTAVTWGKLFVEYEVDFFNPQLPPGGQTPNGTSTFGVGTMTTSTGTLASPMLAGVAQGPIVISQNLTTMTFTGLIVGRKYQIVYGASDIAGANTIVFNTLVGLTLSTSIVGATVSECATSIYLATATTASLNVVLGGAPVAPTVLTVMEIPLATAF